MIFSNATVAKLFRNIAASYTLKKIGNIFQIRAYENAADSIEHSTAEIYDLWEEKRLDEIPGIGKGIQEYLDELFKKGEVKHFIDVEKGIPRVVFDLLDIPGVGPKTASEIAEMGVESIEDLKKQIKNGELVEKGFSSKIAQKIMDGLRETESRSDRMLLPYAFFQAEKIIEYLKKSEDVENVHPLGSLRRMVPTVGDLDFSASSDNPKKVIDYFCKMNTVARILDQGEARASVILKSGVRVDLLVGFPSSYGALLQHFTGSKNHNIKLRELANKMGYSLSENGISRIMNNELRIMGEEIIQTKTEDELYRMLGMQTPPPEIREDMGEIELSMEHKLPNLVKLADINGDLHLHSNYPIISPSHGPGSDAIKDIVKKAQSLGYTYVGVSDHPPGFSKVSKDQIIEWVQKRTEFIHKLNIDLSAGRQGTKSIRVLNGLEVDILGNGELGIPDEAMKILDYCIAGIHSSHHGSKEVITKRLLSALNNPHVDIISHPTNRLLNERESSDADWDEIFKVAAKNNKLLEINSFPNRLDLRDDLVRKALRYGVKFIINTDAHQLTQMDNMVYGISVARRGWAEAKDVVNCWEWTKFAKWFKIDK